MEANALGTVVLVVRGPTPIILRRIGHVPRIFGQGSSQGIFSCDRVLFLKGDLPRGAFPFLEGRPLNQVASSGG